MASNMAKKINISGICRVRAERSDLRRAAVGSKQDSANLLAPISHRVEITLPHATIAAATATARRLFGRGAKGERSLRQLRAEVGDPLSCLGGVGGKRADGFVTHTFVEEGRSMHRFEKYKDVRREMVYATPSCARPGETDPAP
jgi:hypothetical protein